MCIKIYIQFSSIPCTSHSFSNPSRKTSSCSSWSQWFQTVAGWLTESLKQVFKATAQAQHKPQSVWTSMEGFNWGHLYFFFFSVRLVFDKSVFRIYRITHVEPQKAPSDSLWTESQQSLKRAWYIIITPAQRDRETVRLKNPWAERG